MSDKPYTCQHPLENRVWSKNVFFPDKKDVKTTIGDWTMWWTSAEASGSYAPYYRQADVRWHVMSQHLSSLTNLTYTSNQPLYYYPREKPPLNFPKEAWEKWWDVLEQASNKLEKEYKKEKAKERKQTLLAMAKEKGISVEDVKHELKAKREEKHAEVKAEKMSKHVERLMRFSTELKSLNDEIGRLTKKLSDDPENFKLPGSLEGFEKRVNNLRWALRRCK